MPFSIIHPPSRTKLIMPRQGRQRTLLAIRLLAAAIILPVQFLSGCREQVGEPCDEHSDCGLDCFTCEKKEDAIPEDQCAADESTGESATSTTMSGTVDSNPEASTATRGNETNEAVDESEDTGDCVDCMCNILLQDCPDGLKCMPVANDGGDVWNIALCRPIDTNPGQPGDECMAEISPVSGFDDCALGSMCWDVDPNTGAGTCAPLCTGDEANPICDDNPNASCAFIGEDGVLPVCLPTCHPIDGGDCPGQSCYMIGDSNPEWYCAPDGSGGQTTEYGDACDVFNDCDAGWVCVTAEAVPFCNDGARCCTRICDLTDASTHEDCDVDGGQACLAAYPSGVPAELDPSLENVGICSLPW
jgi:hypothetical protein